MAWRALIRRCPTRSMTIVGDVAQTSSPAGARSWSAVLTPLLRDAWRLAELTVNYRTPEAVATAARTMALAAGLPVSPLTSAREIPGALQIHPAPATELRGLTLDLALDTAAQVRLGGIGQVAVVVGADQTDAVRAGLTERALARGEDPTTLADAVVVLSPAQVKGLEFDAVVLEEPAEIFTGPGGASDLYVAMTRPTKYLHMTHARALPAGLTG